MQAVLALAFLALANAAIIDPTVYYKTDSKIYPEYVDESYLGDAVISSPVSDAVIAGAASAGVAPAWAKSAASPWAKSAASPWAKSAASPWAKSAASPWASIIAGAAPAVSSAIPLEAAYAPALKTGLAHAIPAVKSASYHLVKADYPYFTAAPTTSYVEAASPVPATAGDVMTTRHLYEDPAVASAFPADAASLFAVDPALKAYSADGFVHAASPTTAYVAAPAGASAVAPAGAISLVKSAGSPWAHLAPASATIAPPGAAGIHLMKAAFAPATPASAVHAIHPASASIIPASAGFSLVRAAPSASAAGLFGADALSGFAATPAAAPTAIYAIMPSSAAAGASHLVRVASPASALFGAESAVTHAHLMPALKAAFPATASALTGADALTLVPAAAFAPATAAFSPAASAAAMPALVRAFPSLAGAADSAALSGMMMIANTPAVAGYTAVPISAAYK